MSRPRTDWRSDPTIVRSRESTETPEVSCSECICEMLEYCLYWQCPVICIGVLAPAAIVLADISDVEEYIENNNDTVVLDEYYYDDYRAINSFSEHSLRTFDGGSARAAAAWSLLVSSIAMLSPVGVVIACFYSVFEDYYVRYSIVTSVFCFVIGISLLAGGIPNTILYVDNNKLWSDKCSDIPDDVEVEICSDLRSLSNAELACGILSIVSSLMFLTLSCNVAYRGYHKHKKNSSLSQDLPSYEQTSAPSHTGIQTSTGQGMEPITPSFEQPWAPSSALPLSFQPPLSVQPSAPPLSVQPSAPPTMEASEPSNPSTNEPPPVPKHDSNAPPSYESTLTELPTYESALTDTDPVD